MKVKVNCYSPMKVYHSFQFRDLFSVEMGNSLEQYRASISLNNSGPRSRRKQPDVFSAALTDLLKNGGGSTSSSRWSLGAAASSV